MRRFLFILLAALVGVGLSAVVRLVFPRGESHASKAAVVESSREADATTAGSEATPRPQQLDQEPWPTGYVVVGRRVTIQMSDGTTRIERVDSLARTNRLGVGNGHGEVTDVDRNAVVIDGRKMFIKPAPRPVVSPLSPGTPPVVPLMASGLGS